MHPWCELPLMCVQHGIPVMPRDKIVAPGSAVQLPHWFAVLTGSMSVLWQLESGGCVVPCFRENLRPLSIVQSCREREITALNAGDGIEKVLPFVYAAQDAPISMCGHAFRLQSLWLP
jgi:hypothetical protein